jgi:hypothetical protein
MKPEEKLQFLIQIERPNQKLDMERVRKLLEPTGMKIDHTYGPILVNPARGRFVVRGTGSPGAKAKAEKIGGIQLFRDMKIQPTKA